MPSFDAVNYSLRPSKSIQRQLVFDGVRLLKEVMDLDRLAYVGFGSIWFTDFLMAHKLLSIDDMVSIESDPIGYRRAVFNCPYATLRVREGIASEVLPSLYEDELMAARPWMVWLDYDYEFNESVRDDIRSIIENAPANSLLLVTFNGQESRYGQAQERPERLRELFGSVVPDALPRNECRGERMQESLANFAIDLMKSVAADMARPGGFVPAFRLIYKDTAHMVTVGGILPARGAARVVADRVGQADWPCRPQRQIVAPHLTIREAAVLQSHLPCQAHLSRELVRKMGFDLEEEQLAVFERYYRQYPTYAQIVP